MDDNARLNLRKMIDANNVEDFTSIIKEKKHSMNIRDDVMNLLKLKKEYARLQISNPNQFDTMCVSKCNFIFNNYTDIYNKIKKDEIDVSILWKLLDVLEKIEHGSSDQHEASFEVGTLLKKIYIDSALKKSEHLDKVHAGGKKEKKMKDKKLTWREYKMMNL